MAQNGDLVLGSRCTEANRCISMKTRADAAFIEYCCAHVQLEGFPEEASIWLAPGRTFLDVGLDSLIQWGSSGIFLRHRDFPDTVQWERLLLKPVVILVLDLSMGIFYWILLSILHRVKFLVL